MAEILQEPGSPCRLLSGAGVAICIAHSLPKWIEGTEQWWGQKVPTPCWLFVIMQISKRFTITAREGLVRIDSRCPGEQGQLWDWMVAWKWKWPGGWCQATDTCQAPLVGSPSAQKVTGLALQGWEA